MLLDRLVAYNSPHQNMLLFLDQVAKQVFSNFMPNKQQLSDFIPIMQEALVLSHLAFQQLKHNFSVIQIMELLPP